jgi:hypothetical protein
MSQMPDECSPTSQAECIKKFAVLETQQVMMMEQNNHIIKKLEEVCPAVKENSWWIEKIKWGFVFVAIVGVVLGILEWLKRG